MNIFIVLNHFQEYHILHYIYLATLMPLLCYLYLKGLVQNAFTQFYYYYILIRRNRQNKHDLFGKQQYIFSIKPIEDEDNNDVSIHM